jgi:hypothetical protein
MEVQITKGFVLDPEILELRLEIDEIIEDETKSLDIEDLNAILGTVTGFIKNYINNQMGGIKIQGQQVDNIFVDLNQTILTTHDHYLHFSCSPKFIVTKNKNMFQSEAVYVPEELTEEKKLAALTEVIKMTPIWTAIQAMK